MQKMSIESRKNQIFVTIMENGGETEGTIAKRVGLKRSPYTRKILLELVADGSIVREWSSIESPPAFVYYIQQTEELPL